MYLAKRHKNKEYYNKFPDYSYPYKIKSYERLLFKINHLSTNDKYKDKYIFDILKPNHIENLNNATKEEFKRIEYNSISNSLVQ